LTRLWTPWNRPCARPLSNRPGEEGLPIPAQSGVPDPPESARSASAPADESPHGSKRGVFGSALSFLKRHPILCLLLLTPGIPEYLSGSSPLGAIILNPPQFVFQLVANLGLYGPGVLLIREAMIRWKKGWAAVLVLGAAYGILEEGVALSTLFDPKAGPVGRLGYFGHWLGVNWIWSAVIVPVHMLFSISIPILLLGLALPATRGTSLLSRRGVAVAFAVLIADVAFLSLLVHFSEHFWMGDPVFILSLTAIGALVFLATKVPPAGSLASTSLPRASPRKMALVGLIYYPSLLLVESLGMGLGAPASVDFPLVVLAQVVFLLYVLRVAGSSDNEPQLIALSFGLIVPIAAIGLIATIAFPLELLGDLLMVLFFRMLWTRYRVRPGPVLPL